MARSLADQARSARALAGLRGDPHHLPDKLSGQEWSRERDDDLMPDRPAPWRRLSDGTSVRVLAAAEVQHLFPHGHPLDLTEYAVIFVGVGAGRGFEVTSDEHMSARALKWRLGQAARRTLGAGVRLEYTHPPCDDDIVIFRVVQATRRG